MNFESQSIFEQITFNILRLLRVYISLIWIYTHVRGDTSQLKDDDDDQQKGERSTGEQYCRVLNAAAKGVAE